MVSQALLVPWSARSGASFSALSVPSSLSSATLFRAKCLSHVLSDFFPSTSKAQRNKAFSSSDSRMLMCGLLLNSGISIATVYTS